MASDNCPKCDSNQLRTAPAMTEFVCNSRQYTSGGFRQSLHCELLEATREIQVLREGIHIRELPAADGGGWIASIPSLGEAAYVGDGDTPEAALANLMTCKREIEEDGNDAV